MVDKRDRMKEVGGERRVETWTRFVYEDRMRKGGTGGVRRCIRVRILVGLIMI